MSHCFAHRLRNSSCEPIEKVGDEKKVLEGVGDGEARAHVRSGAEEECETRGEHQPQPHSSARAQPADELRRKERGDGHSARVRGKDEPVEAGGDVELGGDGREEGGEEGGNACFGGWVPTVDARSESSVLVRRAV